VLSAFEAAEEEPDAQRRDELLTFVIVGGGPTGVELAGAIAELARRTLRDDFRNINPADARIMIIDGQDRMLGSFPPNLSQKAEASLTRLGIELRHKTKLTAIHEHSIEIETGEIQSQIRARTVLWAAGVGAAPIGKTLAAAIGMETDRAGRVPVDSDLSLVGFSQIFVIGDLAACLDNTGKPLPGVAPVAIQQGKYVGKTILAELNGKPKPSPFRYRDKGSLATIGRSAAVADLGKLKFSGFFAWVIWTLVHIMSIAMFENRVLVFFQWAGNYVTSNRSARLITESSHVKGRAPMAGNPGNSDKSPA
jgi:NADH dehydrogenase